jgi:hypothetical protein
MPTDLETAHYFMDELPICEREKFALRKFCVKREAAHAHLTGSFFKLHMKKQDNKHDLITKKYKNLSMSCC